MLTEKPRRVPPLPALFAEIVRFDAETNAQRTDVIYIPGYAQRRKRRAELSAAAKEAVKPVIGTSARG